jgi:hypothetical protein
VKVRLSKTGVKLLDAARRRKLKAAESAKPSSGKTVTKAITLVGT